MFHLFATSVDRSFCLNMCVWHFNSFPYSKDGTNAPKIAKLDKPANNNAPTTSRRKRRLLEVIDSANDAEKDDKEMLELVRYASLYGCGAQNALNCFAYPDGTKACRNLTARQVEHAIKYVTYLFAHTIFTHMYVLGGGPACPCSSLANIANWWLMIYPCLYFSLLRQETEASANAWRAININWHWNKWIGTMD